MHRPVHGGNLDWASQWVGCLPSDILDFSASINPLGPPESAIAAITQHLHELQAYPDPSYRIFRKVLAEHHDIHPDWICPGNGSAELLTWVCRQLAQYDGTVILTPAFSDYKRSLSAFGAKVVECSMMEGMDGWRGEDLKSAGVIGAIGLGQILGDRLLSGSNCVLINNPHNPTGYLWQRDEILALVDRAAMVVVDEAFMDFLPPEDQQSVIDAVVDYPNLVVLRSLTKFYSLPGLRIGYAIAHPDHLQQWQQWRDPWPVNALAVAAAIASLSDRPFQQQTWNWLQAVKPKLLQGLHHISGLTPYPGAANYLLVHSTCSTVELQHTLLETDRLLIRDCVSFPELGDRYFRIAVRTMAENQRLLMALGKVGGF
ncbi:MAG: threonine-phosphate decarboxylase [Merismopedia sp. SIO2A8]|nr:threonine-phosphate decarboxylase [Merismopedia sp. SIO2A8]